MLMKWLENKSINTKAAISPIIFILIILVVAISTFWFGIQQRDRLVHLETDSQQKSKFIEELISSQFTVQRELLITLWRNSALEKSHINIFKKSQVKLGYIEKNYKLGHVEKKLVDDIKINLGVYKQAVMGITYVDKKNRMIYGEESKFDSKFNGLINLLEKYKIFVDASGKKELKSALTKAESYQNNFFIFLSLAVILVAGVIMIVSKTITTPIRMLLQAIEEDDRKYLISQLSVREDEIGKLSREFIRVRENELQTLSLLEHYNKEEHHEKKNVEKENKKNQVKKQNEKTEENSKIEQLTRNELSNEKVDIDQEKLQSSLVYEKKYRLLDMLITGLTREINAPIGESMSSASLISISMHKLNQLLKENKDINHELLMDFMSGCDKNADVIIDKLETVDDVIKNIKKVDIVTGDRKPIRFALKELIDESVKSFKNKTQGLLLVFEVDIDPELKINRCWTAERRG